jgi:hypothetical protein
MSELDNLELTLRIKTQGEKALDDVAAKTRVAGSAANESSASVDRYVRNLERQAQMAGKTAKEQLGLRRSFAIADYGKTTQQVDRINKSYDALAVSTRKAGTSIKDMFASFAQNAGNTISNPFQALGAGAESFLTMIGPGGAMVGGAMIGLGLIAREAYSLTHEFTQAAHETVLLSERLGITAGQARNLEKAAYLAGVNIYSLEASSRILAAALEDTSGQGAKAGKALQSLGIDTHAVGGEIREIGGVTLELIEKLGKITDQTLLVRTAQQTLGRASKELLPLIKNYQEYQQTLKELGIQFDTNAIQKAAEAETKFKALDLAWQQFTMSLKKGITPIVIPVVVGLTKAMNTPSMIGSIGALGGAVHDWVRGEYGSIGGLGNANAQMGAPANNEIDHQLELGKQQAAKFKASFGGNDVEGIKKQVEELKKDNLKIVDELKSDKVFGGTRATLDGQYKSNEANIKKLEARAKAIEGMPALLEQMREKLATTQASELTGIEKINAEYDKEIAKLKHLGELNPQTLDLASRTRDAEISKFNKQLAGERNQRSTKVMTAADEAAAAVDRTISAGQLSIDELRGKSGNPEDTANSAYASRLAGAKDEFASAAKRIQAMRDESQVRESLGHDQIKLEKEIGEVRVQQIKASGKYAEEVYKADGEHAKDLIKAEQDRIKADRQIADIQLSSEKSTIQRQFGRQQGIGDLMTTPGNEVAQIQKTYQLRIALSDQLASKELDRLKNETDLNKKRIDAANLLKDIDTERGEAELDREMKLLELQHKRVEEAKTEAGNLASAIMGGGHGLQAYFKGMGTNLAHGVLTNVLTPIVSGFQTRAAGAIPGQRDDQGGMTSIGKWLQGTILGSRDDIKNAPLMANTVALNTLTTALTGKAIAGADPSVGGSVSSGSGILGSLGKLFSGGSSTSTDSFGGGATDTYGNPTFGNPTYDQQSQGYALGDPTSFSSNTGKYLTGGAMLAGGAFAAYNGFSRGGAQGALQGTAGVAGMASGVMAMAGVAGPAAPIVAAIGMGLGMISALLGDPKERRQTAISREIRDALYMAPPSVSVSSDITGARTRTNRAGQTEGTPWDAFAFQVNSPYYIRGPHNSSNLETVPGTVIYLSMPINAFDAKSVIDQRNNIAAAVHQAMQEGHAINYQVQNIARH